MTRARARARIGILVLAFVACHHADNAEPTAITIPPKPPSAVERMLALLPVGAQVIVELDLARLRANATVGPLASKALAQLGADAHVPGLPLMVVGSPLASADAVVLAAYGVGTAQAATVTVIATKADVPNATRLGPDLEAVGPDEWTSQLQTRAQLAAQHPLSIPDDLKQLREHAQPEGTTGAVLRVTAQLSFDARVALERLTDLDAAPARISLWADVADDLAIVLDADALDPGDQTGSGSQPNKNAAKRLAHTIRGAFAALGDQPFVRTLGVEASLDEARLIAHGTWVRAIVAVGPRHLARVVERARAMLVTP